MLQGKGHQELGRRWQRRVFVGMQQHWQRLCLSHPPRDTGSGLGALLALGEGQSKAKSRTPCPQQAPSLGLALGPCRELPWLSWGTERALSGEQRGDTYPVPLVPTGSYPQASSSAATQTHSLSPAPHSGTATATHCFGGKLHSSGPFVCINLFKPIAGTIFSNTLRRQVT